MSQQVDFSGETHTLPDANERGWGSAVTAFLVEVAQNALTLTTTLLAELDLGATAGLRALWLRSKTANPAAAGFTRLARADTHSWRNQANDADLELGVDASDNLEWEGADVVTVSGTQTLTNKTLSAPALSGVATGSFTAPAFTALGAPAANWDPEVGNSAPRYWKDALGFVHVLGILNATGVGSSTFFAAGALPVNHRPLASRLGKAHFYDDSTGSETLCPCYAAADGSMLVVFPGVAAASGDTLSFEVSFLAEQ